MHLRSDIERKHLFGAAETKRLPQSGYSATATTEVYARLQRKAKLVLEAGSSVICDAVHAEPDERSGIERIARKSAVPFDGIWLEAPLDLRIERVKGRVNDASDANADYVRRQSNADIGTLSWHRVEASGMPSRIAADVLVTMGLSQKVGGTNAVL